MAFKPFERYCKPVKNGVWSEAVHTAFGAYTPCATDSVVVCTSYIVLLCLSLNRIWRMKKDFSAQRFKLRSNYYNYLLGLLALCCTAEPLFRWILGISAFNVDAQLGFAPYEIVSLVIESMAWCSMLIMIVIETKYYIRETRWIVKYGVIYVLVGNAAILNLILSAKDFYDWFVLYLNIGKVVVQVLFGVLLLVYVPHLDPYPGYSPMVDKLMDDTAFELSKEEQVFPERHTSIFSKITFGWMNSIMAVGYKRPLTENDVWKLDAWDRTETLNDSFQKSWSEEIRRPKPWLLRALNRSLGGRFWWAGFWKVMNCFFDCSYPSLNLSYSVVSVNTRVMKNLENIGAMHILYSTSLPDLDQDFESQYTSFRYKIGYSSRHIFIQSSHKEF